MKCVVEDNLAQYLRMHTSYMYTRVHVVDNLAQQLSAAGGQANAYEYGISICIQVKLIIRY